MDRSISGDGREPEITGQAVLKDSWSGQRESCELRENDQSRHPVQKKIHNYRLTDTQQQAMADIGRFRTLSIADLVRYRYQDDNTKMRQDCRQLLSQRLIQTRSVWVGK